MANFPFPTKISQSSTVSYDQQFLVSNYGDGYEQRASMGINSKRQSWSVMVNYLTLSERSQFLDFWNQHGRVESFTWTPPDGVQGKYIFNTGISETNRANRYSFNFELKQVFE